MHWRKHSVLGYPNISRKFVLETDTSLNGLGDVLSQQGKGGKIHVIAYASHSLHPFERSMHNYSSTKVELLVLKWVVMEKFQDYWLDSYFKVYTVNNPLTYVQDSKLGASQIWWLSELALLNFAMKYWTGHSNKAADALSHCPLNLSCDTDSETDSDDVEVISYSSVCEVVDQCFNSVKIPEDLKQEVQDFLCSTIYSRGGGQKWNSQHTKCCLHFWTSNIKTMSEEQQKDPILKLVYQQVTAGKKSYWPSPK